MKFIAIVLMILGFLVAPFYQFFYFGDYVPRIKVINQRISNLELDSTNNTYLLRYQINEDLVDLEQDYKKRLEIYRFLDQDLPMLVIFITGGLLILLDNISRRNKRIL